MSAILRRKKNWEHYHEQQVVVVVRNSQELISKCFKLLPILISFSLFLAYRFLGFGVLFLKVLFIKPQLIQRIDPESAVDVESYSTSSKNFLS